MNLVQEALNEMRRQDGTEIVSERIIDRARGNLAGAGAAGKWLWNRVSGKKDQNQAGFRETTRNARFSGTIKSHAKVVHDLLGEINQFIAQQAEQGKDTSELEKISGGISDFFAKNEKIFGMGLGDSGAEDYKNQELPTQQEQPEQSAQPEQPEQSASPEQPEQSAQPEQPEQTASGQQGQPAQPGPSTQPRSRQQMQQLPVRKKKKSGFWTNDNVWLNARNESTALNYLYGQILLGENNDEHNAPAYTISSLYNKILISEAQQQPKQQMPPEVNNAIAQVYSKLGDLADQGSEEDKDFVYQLIQKMAQGTPMQEILKELEARGNQEKQQAQQQPQESVTEGFSDMRRRFYARQAGKEAAKAGGDRKAAQQEAYDNRIFEFQTRLDRALGELSLDLKTMGYKQQGGDADKLILAFRKAVSQFSKSKKEEGETSWLQRRRHGLGHALATSATYAALRTICPATILGNKYFARGLYGAATSVIRDVSRGNLNKKSILRALVGAGIAVGGTIAGEMISSPKVDLKDIDVTSSNQSRAMGDSTGIGHWSGHNGTQMTYKGTYGKAGNLGTKIRALFDKDLRSKLGLNLEGGATSRGYSGRWGVDIPTGKTDYWGNPEFEHGVKNLTFDDFAEKANQTAGRTIKKLIDAGVPEDDAKKMVGKELKDLLAHYKNLAATGGNTGGDYDSEGFRGMLNSLKAAKEAGSGAAEAATESATDAATDSATDAATDMGNASVGDGSGTNGTNFRALASNNVDDVYNKMLNDPDYAGDEIVKVKMGNRSYVWNKETDEVFGATGKPVKSSLAERIRMGAANARGKIAGDSVPPTEAATGTATDTVADTATNAGYDVTLSTQSGMPVTVKGLKPGQNPYDVVNKVRAQLGGSAQGRHR